MIGLRARACAALLTLLLANTLQAETILEKFDAADVGWFSRQGAGSTSSPYTYSHDTGSYIAGRYTDSWGDMAEFRNFFVFDLTAYTGNTIESARLEINTLNVAGGSLTFGLFNVTSLASNLISPESAPPEDATPLDVIYDDLGEGEQYGVYDIDPATPRASITIPLSSALFATPGAQHGLFAIGGAMTALAPDSTENQYAFGYINGAPWPRLVLETTVPETPEPGTAALLLTAVAALLAFSRWRRLR